MRKLILLSIIVLNTLSVKAQMDTIPLGVEHRDSTYYYHCWVDEHISKVNCVLHYWSTSIPWKMAKPFYTDVPLNVIGVACAIDILTSTPDFPNEELLYDTVPEYFELYEATDTSFEMIASVRWDTLRPTKCLTHPNTYPPQSCFPIYEAYFDSAITVYDSFYVAHTAYNNTPFLEPDGYGNMVYHPYRPFTYLSVVKMYNTSTVGDSSIYPCMPYIKRKYLPVEGDYYDSMRVFVDTGIALIDTTLWYYDFQVNILYLCMFPIFDTTGYYRDTCADVSNIGIVTDKTSATLSWGSASDHIGWDIAYGYEGTPPESCTIVNTTSNVYWLPDLDSAKWYVAYVRALCDDNKYSNWSDSIRFYITGDTTQVSIQNTVLEEYTQLIPNPASDIVSIFSSFSIRKVEVYSLKGEKLIESDVENVSISLDVSTLPKGIYLVKVYTPHGVATKKLVVN